MPKKAPEKIGSVLRVPLSQLHPHPQNPFAVRDDSAMQELKESVSQNGVLVPAIARPRAEGGYELIAGHRRKYACEQAAREITQAEIDEALQKWNGSIDSKRAVVRYMETHSRERDTAAWLAHEYGADPTQPCVIHPPRCNTIMREIPFFVTTILCSLSHKFFH